MSWQREIQGMPNKMQTVERLLVFFWANSSQKTLSSCHSCHSFRGSADAMENVIRNKVGVCRFDSYTQIHVVARKAYVINRNRINFEEAVGAGHFRYFNFFSDKKWFSAFFISLMTCFCTRLIYKAHTPSQINLTKHSKNSFLVAENIPKYRKCPSDDASLCRIFCREKSPSGTTTSRWLCGTAWLTLSAGGWTSFPPWQAVQSWAVEAFLNRFNNGKNWKIIKWRDE